VNADKDPPAPPTIERRVSYSWQLGQHCIANGTFPFGNIWYNDQGCLNSNFTYLYPGGCAPSPTAYQGWLIGNLNDPQFGLRACWQVNQEKPVFLQPPQEYVNAEFRLRGAQEAAYGLVSRERANNLGQDYLRPAYIIAPGNEELKVSALLVGQPLLKNYYTATRATQGKILPDKARELQKWNTLNELNVDNVGERTDYKNAMSIGFHFEHNGLTCLFTGDTTGRRLREGLSTADRDAPFKCWDIIKVCTFGVKLESLAAKLLD
jgi:hypothetical protein